MVSASFAQQSQKLDSLLSLIETHKDRDSVRAERLVKASYQLGYINPEKALFFAEESLGISKMLKLNSLRFKSLLVIGMSYYQAKVYEEALVYNLQALTLADSLQNDIYQAITYSNIANIYADFGKFDEALNNYQKFLDLSTSNGDIYGQIEALTNIGVLQTDRDSLINSGIINLKQALTLAQSNNQSQYILNIKQNLGLAYSRKKDFKIAKKYYYEVIDLGDKTNHDYGRLMAHNNLSTIYFKERDYKESIKHANITLGLATSLKDLEWQSNAWGVLSDSYEAEGKYKNALDAHKNYSELKDSLNLISTKAKILKLEDDYVHEKEKLLLNAKHNQETELNLQEIKHQKFLKSLSLFGGFFVLLSAMFVFGLLKRKREAKFNLEVAETELKALRAQMNPHFIFNSLNSINTFVANNDRRLASSYLSKFSKLMRQTLENSEKKVIPLSEDLDLLKSYLEIENKRFVNGFNYKINIDSEIDTDNLLVPPMIIQPFVENSIWHGISKLNDKGLIIIEVKKDKSHLMYAVDDNGVGRNADSRNENMKKSSMGIKITQNRIDILNKQNTVKSSLVFIDKAKGTRVEVRLPILNLFSND